VPSLLVLFDIDGTLVLTSRAGVRALTLAFQELHGVENALDDVPIAGRTDRAIVIDAMRRAGIEPDDPAILTIEDRYLDHLQVEIARPIAGHPSCVLPGVIPLLDALEKEPGVRSALLTGNLRRGAAIKLAHFQLWDRFGFGAFGDEHVDRRALLPIALEQARRAGVVTTPDRVVIVGDTPHDIDCAAAHGARAIGVATGSFSREALGSAGAGLALDTLEPVQDVLAWLRG
jgi:phosphoglycolate phosphatase-like HAD superfamily hydrolase